MKKIFLFVSLVLLMGLLVSCENMNQNQSNSNDGIDGIVITSEENVRTLKVDETLQLSAVVYPETAIQDVEWSSSDNEIATVNETGLVIANKAGFVSIIATSVEDDEITQEFALIIEDKEPVVILPTGIIITAENDITTCKAGESISLSAIVYPVDASQRVVWTSSDDTVATVRRGTVDTFKEGQVTITVRADGQPLVYASINITVEKNDDPVLTKDWANMDYATHEAYLSAEDETPLKVKGVVTHVSPVSDNKVTYTIQNGTEGFYVYAQDAISFPVEIGKVYEIGGFKKYYRGLHELVDVEYFVELEEKIEYTVNSLDGTNPTDMDEMRPFQSSIVSGTGSFTSVSVNSSKAYNLYADINGYTTTLRVDPAYMSKAEFERINQILSTVVSGTSFDFTGLMTAFGYGVPSTQIIILGPESLGFGTISPKELLAVAAESLTISTSIAFTVTEIVLPTSVEGFTGVKVTWSSDSDLINVETGQVAHDEYNTSVTLTAILSYEGEVTSVDFDVMIFAIDNTEYQVVASLDCEDAEAPNSYGNSPTKSGYAEANVTLGTPKYTWMLRNALISAIANDRYDGTLGLRLQSGKSAAETGRIELLEDIDANVVEFATAIYGNDATGIQIKIEYSFDSGESWSAAEEVITVDSRELQTYRIKLPEGVKRIAIVIVENTGRRVNIDNIKFMK